MNRRTFLKAIGVLGAGAALLPQELFSGGEWEYDPKKQYYWNGIPFIVDENCPNDKIYMLDGSELKLRTPYLVFQTSPLSSP